MSHRNRLPTRIPEQPGEERFSYALGLRAELLRRLFEARANPDTATREPGRVSTLAEQLQDLAFVIREHGQTLARARCTGEGGDDSTP